MCALLLVPPRTSDHRFLFAVTEGVPVSSVADYIKGSMCNNSSCSLSTENPYATIRDPPGLACKHTESSYVEMKSPSHREVPFGGTATLLGGTRGNIYDVGENQVYRRLFYTEK